jgi:FkbM family methyltransferase
MLPLQKSYQQRLDFLNSHDTFCVFGAGAGGQKVTDYLQQHNKKVMLLLDNSSGKDGTLLNGIPVALPTKLNVNDYPVIVASTWHYQIVEQLRTLECKNFCDFSLTGLSKEKMSHQAIADIEWLNKRLADQDSKDELTHIAEQIDNKKNARRQSNYVQYHHPQITLKSGDTVIDGGAFDALSTVAMLPHFACSLDIHAFEPEHKNIEQCEKNIAKHNLQQCITLVPKGLWSDDKILFFSSSEQIHGAGCNVSSTGDIEIKVTDIDSYCEKYDLSPRFIKMDIEGAEYEALIGAAKTIKNAQPYLAICLYHDFDDLWRIPQFIDKLVPSYDMYIGHHSNVWFETVLYCIPKSN